MSILQKFFASEKRKNPRVQEKAEVTIEIISAPEVPELERWFSHSNSIDISLSGVQLYVDIPVPVGTELKLRVIFEQTSECYWHEGIVVWECELNGDSRGSYAIGIHLNMEDNPQNHAWLNTMHEFYK